MIRGHKIIAVVCARGGSKGIPKKNIKLLNGIPLIGHTLNFIKAVNWIDRIVVSTEDQEIKAIAESFGISVPFLRPKKFAGDKISKIPAIIHAVKKAQKEWREKYDIVLDFFPTAPIRKLDDVEGALNEFLKPDTYSLVTVAKAHRNPYFNMLEERSGYAFLSKKLKKEIKRRQDAPLVYDMNGNIHIIWKKYLLKYKTFLLPKTRIYEMPQERSLDIDSQLDFELVEYVMKKSNLPRNRMGSEN